MEKLRKIFLAKSSMAYYVRRENGGGSVNMVASAMVQIIDTALRALPGMTTCDVRDVAANHVLNECSFASYPFAP